MTLKQYRDDYRFLVNKFGYVYDYCGAWCNCGVLEDILLKDCSVNHIKCILKSLIEKYFREGYDDGGYKARKIQSDEIEKDKILQHIIKRHNISL